MTLFLTFFSHLEDMKKFINFYVNGIPLVSGWEIRPMDDDSENESNLEYINFASPKDGVTEEFFFNCENEK